MLSPDKRGVSIMIGYVLLIVIAISLSIFVFVYLQLYLPKDEPQCYDDVALTIEEARCENGEGYVILHNRGLFTVDGVFIRVGEEGRIFKEVINADDSTFVPLLPQMSWNGMFAYIPADINKVQELEIEPYVYIENKPALCERAVITKKITCT